MGCLAEGNDMKYGELKEGMFKYGELRRRIGAISSLISEWRRAGGEATVCIGEVILEVEYIELAAMLDRHHALMLEKFESLAKSLGIDREG